MIHWFLACTIPFFLVLLIALSLLLVLATGLLQAAINTAIDYVRR